MNTMQMVERMDEQLNTELTDSFNTKKAILFGIEQFPPSKHSKVIWKNLAEMPDIYEMLENNKKAINEASYYDTFGIITCGWASPVDSDMAPSQHPEKKRVRLLLICKEGELFSLVRFQDKDDTVTTTNGAGALADAMGAFYRDTRAAKRERFEQDAVAQ